MQKIPALKGFHDLLPSRARTWRWVEGVAHEIFPSFGFSYISTPILERSELFTRSLGTITDIVEKEMYTFEDWDGKKVSLRPEGTASVVRAYLSADGVTTHPVKYYYMGPMFRHERPQAGRLRQFHQIGAEILGEGGGRQDVELLSLLSHFLQKLGIPDGILEINSLGCSLCRPPYRNRLLTYLQPFLSQLCEDCQRRYHANPLRVLDCKQEHCVEIAFKAPGQVDHLCLPCGDHFKEVEGGLHLLSIPYRIRPSLVRGLDYYTKTAFEWTINRLGAQSAVAAGGRYDGLIEELGGASTPAVGFAIGMERLMQLVTEDHAPSCLPLLYIAPLGKSAADYLTPLLFLLRTKGIYCEMGDDRTPLKHLLKRADRIGFLNVLIVGEAEMNRGAAILRNMKTQCQENVLFLGLEETLLKCFGAEGGI